jgi:hypothetical protein
MVDCVDPTGGALGATGDSPGDYVVITGPLVRPTTSQRVGSVNAVCTLIQVTDQFPPNVSRPRVSARSVRRGTGWWDSNPGLCRC